MHLIDYKLSISYSLQACNAKYIVMTIRIRYAAQTCKKRMAV